MPSITIRFARMFLTPTAIADGYRRRSGWLSAVAVALALLSSVASAPPARAALAPPDHTAVLAAIPDVVTAGAPSYVVHGIDELGEWSAAAGVADIKTGAPASPNAAFRIGSISKMFVAVAVLQLVAESKIGLDTPVSAFLPGLLARGDVITIRELLEHRSGLGTTGFGNGHGYTYYPAINHACRDDEDPVAEIKAADVQLFEPGTAFNYSNAGYTALGLVIEKVTGENYEQVLADRIIVPLGLTHTSFQEGVPTWPTPYVRGYGNFRPGVGNFDRTHLTDETDSRMSLFGAAGSGISTARDLATFMHALTHGRLLPDYMYQQMIDTIPTPLGFEYGLGIIRETTSCG